MYGSKLIIDDVIPWGKTLQEHRLFFNLKESDLDKNIACFGDGASSMNAELTQLGKRITSFDPIYQFSAAELESRFSHVSEQKRHGFFWRIMNPEKSTKDIYLTHSRIILLSRITILI